MTMLSLRALFWISVAMIVAIAVIPVTVLLYQWDLRMNEFIYRFDDKTLGAYLSKFYNIKQLTRRTAFLRRSKISTNIWLAVIYTLYSLFLSDDYLSSFLAVSRSRRQ